MRRRPRGLLFDYGGTLVDEVSVDPRAGNTWLFAQASHRPDHVTLEDVLRRAETITSDVATRREVVHLETPWPTLARLIHDFLGVRFDRPFEELELGFWQATVRTEAMPGARDAIEAARRLGIPMAVVSNSSFGEPVIRYELAKHGLADDLAFVMVSRDYAVRKPNPLLFDTAAARLGVAAADLWVVGDRLDTDVAGARAAGMTAIWFNRRQRAEPSDMPDITVEDWNSFLGHLSETIPHGTTHR